MNRPDPCARALLSLMAGALLWGAVGCHNREPQISSAKHLDFNQDVQPILARNCFSCHGPDPEMRKAGLRLDLEESACRNGRDIRMRSFPDIRNKAN